MNKHEEHVQMIKDCEDREGKLSDWERGFIDSLSKQVDNGRALSERQAEQLNKIWDRVT